MVTVFLRQKIAQKDFWEKIRLKLFGGIIKTGLSQPALNKIKKIQEDLNSPLNSLSIGMVTVFSRQKIAQKDVWENIRLKLFGGIIKTSLSQPALNQIKKLQKI